MPKELRVDFHHLIPLAHNVCDLRLPTLKGKKEKKRGKKKKNHHFIVLAHTVCDLGLATLMYDVMYRI
jgi:hypothetical protein